MLHSQPENFVCHSGGASGADTYFEYFAKKYRLVVRAYSYKTKHHHSENKYELSDEEFTEGAAMVRMINEKLFHRSIQKHLKFLARNWFQIKYADEVFAVSHLIKRNGLLTISGGTLWAIEMAKTKKIPIYVYDQKILDWFTYDYAKGDFVVCNDEVRIDKKNFAGIGTRDINLFGINAIEQLFALSFHQ